MSDRSTIKMLKMEQIDLGDRQRKVYKNIEALADDIDKVGRLINPITVKDLGNGSYLLLAGGRRYKAHEHLGREEIEAKIWPVDMTDIEKEIVELLENVARENLTWQERVDAESKIHSLYDKMEGPKKHTLSDTANLLGKSISGLSKDLKLANALKTDPTLATNKTADQAKKALNKKDEILIKRELARRAEKKVVIDGIDKVRAELIEAFVRADYFEAIKDVPDGYVDLVDLDPPWGIDYAKIVGNRGDNVPESLASFVDRDKNNYPLEILAYAKDAYRVLRDGGWLILWFSTATYIETLLAAKEAGFEVNPHPGLWIKPNQGRNNHPGFRLTVDYEAFFYCRKGEALLNKQGRSSIYNVPPSRGGHPNTKPIQLQKDILDTFVTPGSTILSPFLGSGNIIFSAAELGMQAFGFEISPDFRDDFIYRAGEWNPTSLKKVDEPEEPKVEDIF